MSPVSKIPFVGVHVMGDESRIPAKDKVLWLTAAVLALVALLLPAKLAEKPCDNTAWVVALGILLGIFACAVVLCAIYARTTKNVIIGSIISAVLVGWFGWVRMASRCDSHRSQFQDLTVVYAMAEAQNHSRIELLLRVPCERRV